MPLLLISYGPVFPSYSKQMPKSRQRPARPSTVSHAFIYPHRLPCHLQASHLHSLCCSSVTHKLLSQALCTCFSFFLECSYFRMFQFAPSPLSGLCSNRSSQKDLPLPLCKTVTHLIFTPKRSSINSLFCFTFLQSMYRRPTYYFMYLLSSLLSPMRIQISKVCYFVCSLLYP